MGKVKAAVLSDQNSYSVSSYTFCFDKLTSNSALSLMFLFLLFFAAGRYRLTSANSLKKGGGELIPGFAKRSCLK